VHARELLELARRHTRTLSRVIREASEVEAIVRARRDQALGDCRERAAERADHGREVTQQIFRPASDGRLAFLRASYTDIVPFPSFSTPPNIILFSPSP